MLCNYGVALALTGKYDRLATFADRWPDIDDPEFMTIKAKALTELGRHSSALAAATQACVLDDSAAAAWGIRAESHYKLAQHHEESAAAERWLALEPVNALARATLARALCETGDWERALAAIEEGWPGSDQDPHTLTLQARALRGLGQHTDAVAVAARALELRKLAELFGPQAPEEPFPVEALEIHADCLFELGHFGGAAATARQLLRHDAANSLYWFLLTRALIEAQEWNEVLDAAEQWIKIDPCGNAWSRKVQALMELGRWEDARKGAGIVLALRPGDPNALSLGSTACIGCGDLESALKYAERMGS